MARVPILFSHHFLKPLCSSSSPFFFEMFFSASIAIASVLSLSTFTVRSAPLSARARVVEQFCTGPNGSGTCTPLAASGACTNTPGIQSLVLNADADCAAFPLPNCDFNVDQVVFEQFSDDSQDIGDKGFQSVLCSTVDGTVNGFTAGSSFDLDQEAADKAKGIEINL
ncbi:hypothetical protein DFH08DRAFT_944886 [Mycena albidolilacea]|uniref:Uncharacterized protein n=1 Tax=Mycena albidolilacea TaxID=1033008 RepID=A0AAD6Z3F6_9AGAR|nr:hypothetical protein DFH08DRAFT_944886 [Mycena albidolilacea]